MTYTSFGFYIFLLLVLMLYYIVPLRFRWLILLVGSAAFYINLHKENNKALILTASLIIVTYAMGVFINRLQGRQKKLVLIMAIFITVFPWFFLKNMNIAVSWLVPIGISFYTLQMLSYLADIYMGRINVQKTLQSTRCISCFFRRLYRGRYRVMVSCQSSFIMDMRLTRKSLSEERN